MEREIIDWSKYHSETELAAMPWYWPTLSPDLVAALEKRNINTGNFLDIGTGAGTQAVGLAKLGFSVTATDLLPSNWDKLEKMELQIQFLVDNILESKLNGPFDYIFDRGCFHNFEPAQRDMYHQSVARLLKPKGLLFIKCFSEKENRVGPRFHYKFSCESLAQAFEERFVQESCHETIFRGAMAPIALFAVFRRTKPGESHAN